MSRRLPSFEHVFVRHCSPDKRGDFERVGPLIRSGFEEHSSTGTLGYARFLGAKASERWTFALQETKSDWTVLTSNVVSNEELYKANCQSRRSEVIWIRHDADSKDFEFYWTSARKQIVEICSQSNSEELVAEYDDSNEDIATCFKAGKPIEAFQALIQLAELKLPADSIVVEQGKFQVISASQKKPRKNVGPYVIFSDRTWKEEEGDELAERMEDAIDDGDVVALRQTPWARTT